jgi:hypothetical protein
VGRECRVEKPRVTNDLGKWFAVIAFRFYESKNRGRRRGRKRRGSQGRRVARIKKDRLDIRKMTS